MTGNDPKGWIADELSAQASLNIVIKSDNGSGPRVCLLFKVLFTSNELNIIQNKLYFGFFVTLQIYVAGFVDAFLSQG